MARPAPAARLTLPSTERPEAAARLARIRQALRTADLIAGKSAEQASGPLALSEAWPHLVQSTDRCSVSRDDPAAGTARDGLDVWGTGPISPAAAERLRRELRESLAQVERLFAAR